MCTPITNPVTPLTSKRPVKPYAIPTPKPSAKKPPTSSSPSSSATTASPPAPSAAAAPARPTSEVDLRTGLAIVECKWDGGRASSKTNSMVA